MSGSGGVARIGVCTPSAALLGTDALGAGYGGTGCKSHNGSFLPYGAPFRAGDVVACAALREEDALVFSLNGAPLGIAFRLSELGLLGAPLCPALASRGAHVEITTADAWERSLLPVYRMEHVADENARALRRAADGEVAAALCVQLELAAHGNRRRGQAVHTHNLGADRRRAATHAQRRHACAQ